MTTEALVALYGYPALLIGCLLEGGTVVVIAGALAHVGYLDLTLVIGITFCCAFGADQLFFQIGKRKGQEFLGKRPRWQPRIDKVRRFLVAYQVIAILGFRFIYGMRTITPIIIGASGLDTRRFVLLNLCSTLIWSATVASIGFFFGHLIETIMADVKNYKLAIILIIAVIAGGIWLLYRFIKRRRRNGTNLNPTE
jgi:membrane protein DedA with SNARE-associated domain